MTQPWPTPETRYANSGGVHIAYQTLGDGPIDLVFTMGCSASVARRAAPANGRWSAARRAATTR